MRRSGGHGHPGAVSPCSIVDVWSVVALATPWSVCTITESWSASASDVEPGDRMFALTAASIGAAMLSVRRDRRVDRRGEVERQVEVDVEVEQRRRAPSSRSPAAPAASAAGGGSSSISPWSIAESCVDVAFASAGQRLLERRVLVGGAPATWRPATARWRSTAASIGTAALALAATAALIGAARSRSAVEVGVEVEQRRALERAEQVGDRVADLVDRVADRRQRVRRPSPSVSSTTPPTVLERVVDGRQRVADDAADGARACR